MKSKTFFYLFSATVLLFILIIENINGRFWQNDFKVYYLAADAFISGDPVYGVPLGLGTGFYKYSPVLLYFFAPFTLLPFEIAAIVHYLITAVATVAALFVVYNLSSRFWKNQNKSVSLLLSLCFIAILNHLFRELHLGNVNMILIFILTSALRLILNGKTITGGLLLALAFLFKPYFIILTVPLLFNNKWKSVIVSAAVCAGVVALMALFTGIDKTRLLHEQWLQSMSAHSDLLGSNHTVLSIVSFYLHIEFTVNLRFLPVFVVTGLYCLFMLIRTFTSDRFQTNSDDQLIPSIFFFLAIIPNLLITDTEHFLFSMPIIVFSMVRLFQLKDKILAVLFIILLLLYGTNSPDLFGTALSNNIEKTGVLGLANLGLIIFTFILLLRKKKDRVINAVEQPGLEKPSHL